MTDPTCAERIEDQRTSREQQYRVMFMHTAPDLDDADDVTAYLATAGEYGYVFTPDTTQVVHMWKWRGAHGLDKVLPEANETYAGDTLEYAVLDLLRDIERSTDDARTVAVDESVLSVSTKVTMNVLLSTGGPADYLTCDIDTDDRSIDNVHYHFADWFDHADEPVPNDSPLVTLCEYFAEAVDLSGSSED